MLYFARELRDHSGWRSFGRGVLLVGAVLLLLAGCGDQPVAPQVIIMGENLQPSADVQIAIPAGAEFFSGHVVHGDSLDIFLTAPGLHTRIIISRIDFSYSDVSAGVIEFREHAQSGTPQFMGPIVTVSRLPTTFTGSGAGVYFLGVFTEDGSGTLAGGLTTPITAAPGITGEARWITLVSSPGDWVSVYGYTQ